VKWVIVEEITDIRGLATGVSQPTLLQARTNQKDASHTVSRSRGLLRQGGQGAMTAKPSQKLLEINVDFLGACARAPSNVEGVWL